MNTALILIVVGLEVVVDACPVVVASASVNKSCCEAKSVFKFASTPWISRGYLVCMILQISVGTIVHKDIATLTVMGEDGSLFRGEKMAVLTSPKLG